MAFGFNALSAFFFLCFEPESIVYLVFVITLYNGNLMLYFAIVVLRDITLFTVLMLEEFLSFVEHLLH